MCSWLPVHTLATTILELTDTLSGRLPFTAEMQTPPIFYNLVNPHTFTWTSLLFEMQCAGLKFTTVPLDEWLQKLRNSAKSNVGDSNPAVKLIAFFEESYSAGSEEQSSDVGKSYSMGITFETEAVRRDSVALRSPPRIIEEGYVMKFFAKWMESWA